MGNLGGEHSNLIHLKVVRIEESDGTTITANLKIILDTHSHNKPVNDFVTTSNSQTFSDSVEFVGDDPVDFDSKFVKRIHYTIPVQSDVSWSDIVSHALTIKATNTKIEFKDGSGTVLVTATLDGDIAIAQLDDDLANGFVMSGIVEINAYVTDLRIKQYISTTLSTITNLETDAHQHMYGGISNSNVLATNPGAGQLIVEVADE